ncbi:MAG: hypothetical protein HQL39_11805, partial [Alphaproteobacteria bacterium]|nr:hypothetical protein [Alphaproteobacteria bacterium]
APARRGFGSRLLQLGVPHELGGTVDLRFAVNGLEADLLLPIGALGASADPDGS